MRRRRKEEEDEKEKKEGGGKEKNRKEVKIKNPYIKKSLFFYKCSFYTLNIFT